MGNTKGVIITNVIWKFAERIGSQVISLVVSIVLSRLLLPEDYGSISMVLVFIAIGSVFFTEGIPAALIQKKDTDELDYSSAFYFNLFFSVIVYVILYFFAPLIAKFYNNEILCPVVRVLSVTIVIGSINCVQNAYVSRNMLFKKYFYSTLIGTCVSGILGVALAYRGFGVWALVALQISNSLINIIVIFITVPWKPRKMFSLSRVLGMIKYGWKLLVEGLSNTVVGQLQNLIIGKVYTSSDLAYYTKGQQLPSLIVGNITISIASVLFPAMSNVQDEKNTVEQMMRKSIKISSYIVYPMLTGLAVVASPLIIVIFTDKWINAVPYLQIFCLLNAPTVAMIPRHQALKSIGRSDVYMNEHIIARIVSVILLLLVYRVSVMAIALSGIISTAILMCIIMYTSHKYSGYRYQDQIADVLPTLIGCLIMGVPVYFIQLLDMTNFVTLVVQAIVGVLIYIGYSKVFKLEEYIFCEECIKRMFNKNKRRPK